MTMGIMASCLFPAYHHSPRTTCWVRSGTLDLVNYFEIETVLQAFRIVAVHHCMNTRDGNIAGSKLIFPHLQWHQHCFFPYRNNVPYECNDRLPETASILSLV
jgi:hypothetical protein